MNTTVELERNQRLLDSTFFSVSKVRDDDGYKIVDGYGRQISKVSERYELVPNFNLVQPIVDHFGLENVKKVSRWGKSFTYEIETGRSFDIGGVGDLIKERIVIQNSYDKTRSFAFLFGAFRLICTNGLYYGQMNLGYKKIHVGEIPVREIVRGAIENFSRNDFANWNRMQKESLSLDREIDFLNAFDCFEVDEEHKDDVYGETNAALNRRIRSYATAKVNGDESIDNQRNVWGLYNQINRAINAVVASKNVSKKILGNQRTEKTLMETFSLN